MPTAPTPKPPAAKPKADATAAATPPSTDAAATDDPGELAYSDGFHQWEAGQYDQAIATLKAFTAAYPKHKRVSYANNLIGRALLDQGKARDAATVLFANYRTNSRGERAPDSLYYLGQALMALNPPQPSQACKAYGELEDVYGASVRPDLKALVAKGKADASCS